MNNEMKNMLKDSYKMNTKQLYYAFATLSAMPNRDTWT